MLQQYRSLVSDQRRSLAAALAIPSARALAASSALARLPKGMLPLATVLELRSVGSSYSLAGVTAALVAVGDAVSTPYQCRLVDRFGLRRTLSPLAVVHVIAVCSLVGAVHSREEAAVIVSGLGAGVAVPPISGSVKAVWPRVVPAAAVPVAYVLESVLQQFVFLLGPLLVAALVAVISPAAALLAAAACVLAGTMWFVIAAPHLENVDAPTRVAHRSALRDRAVATLTGSSVLQGLALGALPVGIVALAQAAGHRSLAGSLQSALTVGGLLGTALPAGTDRKALIRRTSLLGLALTPIAGLGLFPSVATLVAVGVTLLFAGLLLTPVAATTYTIVHLRIGSTRRAESFAWLSTGQACGNALGAAMAGLLADSLGVWAALAVLSTANLAASPIATLLRD